MRYLCFRQKTADEMRISDWSSVVCSSDLLCTGDLNFFEAAIAHKARVALQNARVLIHDEGDLDMRALYEKTSSPKRLYPAFQSAVGIRSEESRVGNEWVRTC